jgi:hypothetical protein
VPKLPRHLQPPRAALSRSAAPSGRRSYELLTFYPKTCQVHKQPSKRDSSVCGSSLTTSPARPDVSLQSTLLQRKRSSCATCNHTNTFLGLTPIMGLPYSSSLGDRVGTWPLSRLKQPGHLFVRTMASVRGAEITSRGSDQSRALQPFPDFHPFGGIHRACGLRRDLVCFLDSRVRGSFRGSSFVLCIAAFLDAEVGA